MSDLEAKARENKITTEELILYLRNIQREEPPSFLKAFLKKWYDPFLLPPYGKHLLPLETSKDATKILLLSLSILSSFPSVAQADEKSKIEIEWALKALEKINPIAYLSSKKMKNEQRSTEEKIQADESNILAWNIYHESRNRKEGRVGRLAVLLTTLERMKHSNFPSSAFGVVFQYNQYSWANDEIKHPIPASEFGKKDSEKLDLVAFFEIKQITDKITGMDVDSAIRYVRSEIQKEDNNKAVPERITHYHKLDMLNNPKYSGQPGRETRKRIMVIEKLYTEYSDPNIRIYGTQIFYPFEYTNKSFIEAQFIKLGLKLD